MKTREFDPVRSAALRHELEALPTARSAPSAAERLRRPQVWVTAVTAVLLLVATIGVLRLTAAHEAAPAQGDRITDPLTRLTDPDDPQYLPNGVETLLHLSGTGPGTYLLDVPEGTTSVRPLIACSPAADFRITVGRAYWTGCDRTGSPGFADIPVSAGVQPIAVQIPDGVRWRLAVIVTPEEGTTYWTLRVTDAPDRSPGVTEYPAPEQEEDVPVGVAAGGTGTTTGRLFAPVDELALVTSCRGSGGLVVTLSNGFRFGTDDSPLPCGASATTSVQSASNDTARGYRGDGRMTYTVRAVGDVRWTATFSSRTEERLPYPSVSGPLLGRTRGSTTSSFGALDGDPARVRITATCRGTGTLSVEVAHGQTGGGPFDGSPALPCDARSERVVNPEAGSGALRYGIVPSGDVLWTVTFTPAS